MRVLHYLPDIDKSSGGVLTYFQVLSSSLGNMVDLHLLTCHTVDEMTIPGKCKIHYWPVRYLPQWNTRREFKKILDEVRPDVFHTNSCWIPNCSLTAIWAKKAGYRVVYTPHGMMEPWLMKHNYWTKKLPAFLLYQKRSLNAVDVILATSESEKNNLKALGFNRDIRVIPNAIDVTSIEMKTSWTPKRTILYLGRVHEKKGVIHLLEAIRYIKTNDSSKLSGYRIKIVGDSDIEQPLYKQWLIEKTKEMNIGEEVCFFDGVYDERKWTFLKEADVVVLPSYSENFGIVVAEALASGTPVVTTQETPWQELETQHCGWWIKTGTNPLIEALYKVILSADRDLEDKGRRGRNLMEEKYSTNIVCNQLYNLYNDLIYAK